jgi:hypothetical protein
MFRDHSAKMPKIGEVEANDVRSAVLRHDASFEAGQADAGCIQAALFFKKGTTPRGDRRKDLLKGRSCRQGRNIVLGGTLVELVLSGIVAVLTFLTHRRLPHCLTGVMLGFVLLVMVGE